MKPYLLIVVCIIFCLLILFFIFFPNKSNQNPITQIEKLVPVIKQEDNLIEWNQMIEKYLEFPLDNHYGSHAIVLLAALYVLNSGPVLELGMGPTSSPLLHRLTTEQKRFLLSADSDIRWINYFSTFTANNSLHKFKYVEVKSQMGIEWASSAFTDIHYWSIVFIDHAPGTRRQFDLMLFPQRTEIVVLHDTEQSRLYQYSRGLSLYPYQYRFKKLKTYTDVLSKSNETLIKRIGYLLNSTSDKYFSNTTLKQKV
jgi:hypothetical protein